LLGNGMTVLGLNLLHELHDYWWARKNTNIHLNQPVYATGYHLLTSGRLQPSTVLWLGCGLLWLGLGCYLGLAVQFGWPLMFFYVAALVLIYTYSAPPIRYSHWGWGIGEIGLFLGYGLLPLLGSYYIISHQLTKMALLTTIPFGIAAVLLVGNYNFIHQRRDWLMHKRTSVVVAGVNRMMSVHAILTLLIYVAFLCIVSLAYLPVIVLVTLGALPLAMRIYSELRGDDIELEQSFLLYHATVTSVLWTTLLFCVALLVDRFVG
ncbi:MAG: prenyltransferase, partial [Caldilineaceae bacterium]|nr:prenyltransferase [Caldilineaceae bacterium]